MVDGLSGATTTDQQRGHREHQHGRGRFGDRHDAELRNEQLIVADRVGRGELGEDLDEVVLGFGDDEIENQRVGAFDFGNRSHFFGERVGDAPIMMAWTRTGVSRNWKGKWLS